jgi:hypothetical protein
MRSHSLLFIHDAFDSFKPRMVYRHISSLKMSLHHRLLIPPSLVDFGCFIPRCLFVRCGALALVVSPQVSIVRVVVTTKAKQVIYLADWTARLIS